MTSSERPEGESSRIPFELLKAVQADFERHGYFFFPVEREHTEGLITDPLAQRLHSRVKRRGFSKVAGRVIVTFSGYDDDPREIFDIPEIGAYFRKLDSELGELPALLAYLPGAGFNGPGQYLMLLGKVDETVHRPEMDGYVDSTLEGTHFPR